MVKNNWGKVVFIIIIALAVFFRFYKLDIVPPHPSLDEVTIGYNAFSILQTGKDEFGYSFPILLRAYDDWRPAMYTYVVVPIVGVLGLNVMSVRLPSAILSILTVVSFYFLMLILCKVFKLGNAKLLSLTSTFFLALSPWHIYLSRLGHEVNMANSFLFFGVTMFFYALYTKKLQQVYLVFSAIFFSISFDAYQSTKIVVPLFILMLLIIFLKKNISNWKRLIIPGIIALLIALPILTESIKPNALIRLKATSVFNIPFEVQVINSQKLIEFKEKGDYLGLVLYNRRVFPSYSFVTSFVSHFRYSWLFESGRDEQFKIPNFGLLHVYQFLFLLLGGAYLFMRRRKLLVFLVGWYVIGILPSALTTDAPHAMRAFAAIGATTAMSGVGVISFYEYIKRKSKKLSFAMLLTIGVIAFVTTLKFYNSYFHEFSYKNSSQFQYGVLQALTQAKSYENKHKEIYVSHRNNLSASYMYYLYASKKDPRKYQKMGGTKTGWLGATHTIDNYIFTDPRTVKKDGIFLIITPSEFEYGNIIRKIKNVKGEDVIYFVER